MNGDPVGTPQPEPAQSNAQSAADGGDGNEQVTVSAQFKKQALEQWKPAAEEKNKLQSRVQELESRLSQLQNQQYGGGQAATDPRAELVNNLYEQAQFDPVAKATLLNMQQQEMLRAELWLKDELMGVPENKRKQVAEYIRAKGFQVDAQYALNVLTDPDTGTLKEQLAEMQAQLERLRGAKPNGVSPAGVAPSSSSADDGKVGDTIPLPEYLAALRAGGPRAAELKARMDQGKLKFATG